MQGVDIQKSQAEDANEHDLLGSSQVQFAQNRKRQNKYSDISSNISCGIDIPERVVGNATSGYAVIPEFGNRRAIESGYEQL